MDIMRAVTFEGFLARKYPTAKRFGLEGCESFIPSMMELMETSSEKGTERFRLKPAKNLAKHTQRDVFTGVESVVIGMAHRGRLNTLINVCSKPLYQLFIQFNPVPLEGFGSGDVKYHLGMHAEKVLER